MKRAGGTRVLIADDQDLIRELLEYLVAADPDLDLVGSAADTDEVIRLCERMKPEVVVLDWHMPVGDGAGTVRAVAEICPSARVIAYTGASTAKEHAEILAAGAFSYIVKGGSARQIVSAIHAAAQGIEA